MGAKGMVGGEAAGLAGWSRVAAVAGRAQENVYDVNRDGKVNSADVVAIYNYIIDGEGDDDDDKDDGGKGDGNVYLSCPDGNHPHMIDLGLPSGTKWACCNVGAAKPEDYGGYYAWGETEEKEEYSTDTYKYFDRDTREWDTLGGDIAGTQYDVAHVKWGGNWCMPTLEQIQELLDNTESEWLPTITPDGRLFLGSNGGRIFMVAAGMRSGNSREGRYGGIYWASTYMPAKPGWFGFSYCLDSNRSYASWLTDMTYGRRYQGYSVRPVAK